MLDLKAKLAAAGLVSAADVAAAERKPSRPGSPKGHDPKASSNRPGDPPRGGPNQPRPNQPRPDQPRPNQPHPDQPQARPNQPQARPNQHGKPNQPAASKPRPGLDVAALQRGTQQGKKGEAYDAIRRAVERERLDPAHGIPGEHAEPFHFSTAAGQLSRLTLEPGTRTALTDGDAGLIAFMSHHGLAHCVVPRPLAEAVHAVFPLWLRVLKDHPGAGQFTPRPEPTPQKPADKPADSPADKPADDPADKPAE